MYSNVVYLLFAVVPPIKNTRSANQLDKKTTCGVRVSHDRWALNVKLAEARWAQQQARERELEEVKDFLQ